MVLSTPTDILTPFANSTESIHNRYWIATLRWWSEKEFFGWNNTIGFAPPPLGHNINIWWDGMISGRSEKIRGDASDAFIYLMWGIWKDRNRSVF